MTMRRWADLTRFDFETLQASRAIAVLPVGAIEQHGPHLPVKTDTALVEAVLERALAASQVGHDVLVLPTLSYGKSTEHEAFAGTLSLSTDTLLHLIGDIAAGLWKAGIRRLVIFNGHGGNAPVLDIAARDLRVHHGMQVATCAWWDFNDAASMVGEEEHAFGLHAGLVETSAMLAIDPARVAMDRAENFPNAASGWQSDNRFIGLQVGRARPAWAIGDLNTEGACGDAASATADLGERLLSAAAVNFLAFLEEFARFCDAEGAAT